MAMNKTLLMKYLPASYTNKPTRKYLFMQSLVGGHKLSRSYMLHDGLNLWVLELDSLGLNAPLTNYITLSKLFNRSLCFSFLICK